jgi:hypothetical protein|tara:strand:+ start:55 stop:282 length:228 start_codon:yes stop_codon:yes gene_type:complete
VDIKSIGVGLGIVMTLAGVLMSIGSVMNRLEVLEGKSTPNINPIVADIAINKAEIAVLNAKVNEMKARSDNPLGQ